MVTPYELELQRNRQETYEGVHYYKQDLYPEGDNLKPRSSNTQYWSIGENNYNNPDNNCYNNGAQNTTAHLSKGSYITFPGGPYPSHQYNNNLKAWNGYNLNTYLRPYLSSTNPYGTIAMTQGIIVMCIFWLSIFPNNLGTTLFLVILGIAGFGIGCGIFSNTVGQPRSIPGLVGLILSINATVLSSIIWAFSHYLFTTPSEYFSYFI